MSKQDSFSVEDLNEITVPINWSEFDYPISSFTGYPNYPSYAGGDKSYQVGLWSYGPVLGEDETTHSEKDMLNYNLFEKVYLAKPGHNDEEPWIFLIKHQNGYYIYFNASCDFTGFDCQGGGEIKYSKDGKQMWNFGLNEITREELVNKQLQELLDK